MHSTLTTVGARVWHTDRMQGLVLHGRWKISILECRDTCITHSPVCSLVHREQESEKCELPQCRRESQKDFQLNPYENAETISRRFEMQAEIYLKSHLRVVL